MTVTEVRTTKGWFAPSAVAATPPISGVDLSLISVVVPEATLTVNSVLINAVTSKKAWRTTYYGTDPVALGAFAPTASGQTPPSGVSIQPGNAYRTEQNPQLSGLAAGTKYYYRFLFVDEQGGRLLDNVRSFTTDVEVVPGGGGGGGVIPPVSDGTGAKLQWRPHPDYRSFKIRNVTAGKNSLDVGTDYLLVWPDTPLRSGVQIVGGRNIASFGGHIQPTTLNSPGQRGVQIHGGASGNSNRLIHIEGLLINGEINEGVNIDLNGGLNVEIHLSNMLIGSSSRPLHGTYSGHHADLVQWWNGPHKLMIDGLTGYTDYQGFMMQPHQFAPYNNRTSPAPSFTNRWYKETWTSWFRNIMIVQTGSGSIAYNAQVGAPYNPTGTAKNQSKHYSDNCWYTVTPANRTNNVFHSNSTSWPQPTFGSWQRGFNTAIAKTPSQVGIGYISPGYV